MSPTEMIRNDAFACITKNNHWGQDVYRVTLEEGGSFWVDATNIAMYFEVLEQLRKLM